MTRIPALPVLLLLAACAGPGGDWARDWRARHPGAEPAPPQAGAGFGPTIAALDLAPGPGARVVVEELRVLRTEDGAWEPLDPASAETASGTVGVATSRRCLQREGWRRREVPRSSWFLFRDGALVAWDHGVFGPGCSVEAHFRPAREEDLAEERTLVRWLAQRFPEARPDVSERMRMGLAYVEAGRLDDAERMLADGEHAIEAAERDRSRDPGAPTAEPSETEAEWLRLRAELFRALRDAKREARAGPASP